MEPKRLEKDKFEYRVSVIIPIYNVEEYLDACLNSLLAQTIPQKEMEVLMVNDGSPDGSLDICTRYAMEHPNFKVISQENQGVSAARNNGIKNAKGKYLLYLDGDDMLSPETVENLTVFFDKHYDEVDVVTYPLAYESAGTERFHWRREYLKETGVYDLDEYPYVSQTTINICVKNKGEENILFNKELAAYEDQTYNLAQCMPLKRLGYCREAKYLYFRRASGVVEQFSHPYYLSELLLQIYQAFLDRYDDALYVQAYVLYDINWRICGDCFYPYHYDEERMAAFQKKVTAILRRISTNIIWDHPRIDFVHKGYYSALKENGNIATSVHNNQLSVIQQLSPVHDRDRDFAAVNLLCEENKVLIVMNQSRIQDDKLYLLAYLKNVAFSFMEKPRLFAVVNDEYIEVPLFLSQCSCYKTNIRTNTFWGFHFKTDLRELESLRFVVRLRGQDVETRYWFNNKGILPKIGRSFLAGKEYGLLYKDDVFYGLKTGSIKFRRAAWSFECKLCWEHKKQWLARKYMNWGRGKKRIWLYQDSYHAIDNSYWQFQHDFNIDDGVKRYYVCNKDHIDWRTLFPAEQQPFLIERGSRQHKRLFAQAEKILASYVDRASYVPFDATTIAFYWDLFHFEVIYLQHGVMHAELPNMYSKEKVYLVDKIVASTRFEKENFLNRLAFREEDIICCGMARLDNLKRVNREKKFLFAPSWRNYLVGKDAKGNWCRKNGFISSDYFQEIKAFLTAPKLLSMLERTGYRMDIKLHPNFSMYSDDFAALESENIRIVANTELGEYAACITDFSSYMYDLFYLGIPVFTHIFDYDRFKAGLHSYRNLAWPMETEYSYYCSDRETLLILMGRIMKDTQGLQTEFDRYVQDMFFTYDSGHAQALYQHLMESR